MDQRTRPPAVLAARRLLESYRRLDRTREGEALPLDDLVSQLGLEVATFHPADYAEGTFGWLEPGENLIWLCRDLPETLRRFTLAHELGHAVLHRAPTPQMRALLADLALSSLPLESHEQQTALAGAADPCLELDISTPLTEEGAEELLGPGQSYSPRSRRELAANLFAAELLMPLDRVRALYLEAALPPQQLASLFGVSAAAMLNRLASLLKEFPPMQEEKVSQQPAAVAAGEGPAAARAASNYDEFQRAAIEAPTPALIVAGPGSGKTSTLIGRATYLIQRLRVPPQQILALTFSRKAAEEMQERLQHALEIGGGSMELRRPPTVSTFHAFCAEFLRQYCELAGLRPDFALVDDTEGYFLLRSLATRLPLFYYRHLTVPTLYFPDILKAISRAKDELVTPERYRQLAERMREQATSEEAQEQAARALEIAAIYALYQEELQRRGDIDFGGLIMLTVQLLQEHPEVLQELQSRYQQILVDEFQDINRASGVLLRLLAGEAQRVWVVGDANQAIYGFRGASPANIASFRDDYPNAVVLPLSRNYRSRPDIVSLAEAFRCNWLERENAAPVRNQAVRTAPVEPYVTLASAADEAGELAGLIADIRQKRRQGYACRDLVVLCRTRAQTRRISRALAAAGLPVIEGGGTLEQEHVKDALACVLLLAGTDGMGLLRAARCPDHALAQADIECLLRAAREQQLAAGLLVIRGEAPPEMSAPGRQALRRLSEILQRLSSAPDIWSLLTQYLFLETDIMRRLLRRGDAQARALLADYEALLQLARRYDQQQQRLLQRAAADTEDAGSETARPSATIYEQARGFVDYLRVLLTLRQDSGSRQQGMEGMADGAVEVIRVMTVHASKGLEFPVIYLPGLTQQRFPSPRRYSPVTPPDGMLAFESSEAELHDTGEACLFYVGVTRARDQLILSYSERLGKRATKPSIFLEPLLAGLPAERLIRLHWKSERSDEVIQREADLAPSSQPDEAFIARMQSERLSAAAVESYQQCPRRYLYSHIYRFQLPQEAYSLFVQATRRTIETLHERLRAAATAEPSAWPSREEVHELYRRHWQELGGHDTPFGPLYEQHGHEVVDQIHSRLQERDSARSWQPGQSFSVSVAGTEIRVEVDRVETPEQPGQPARFIRTRFGRRKQEPEPDTRELLYAQAYRAAYPGSEVELHHDNLSTGEIKPVRLGRRREQTLYTKLVESVQGLQRHDYPAAPADPARCPTCPFFLICPA
jgi:DNA helicase-2/ATP-dependent DNA helicase PcrA